MTTRVTNWAGNLTYGARRWHRPGSVAELQRLVAGGGRVRAAGTGHSFSRLADSAVDGDLVTVAGLPQTIDIDPAAATVTVAAGIRYGELATRLHAAGYALANLASLPHISVAGACATATHGSGVGNLSLAGAVRSATLVTGGGELITVDPRVEPGAVVHLGALGVVTSLTLDIEPGYEIRQFVYENLPWHRLERHLPEVLAAAYSVSLFTDWAGPLINQVWLKHRVSGPAPAGEVVGAGGAGGAGPAGGGGTGEPVWLDARLAGGPRHPIPGMPTDHCTAQGGLPGPWHTRLPHFRLEHTPSAGDELQSEYFVARESAFPALAALAGIRARIAPLLQVSEVRTVAADPHWLSPAYQRDSVAIHFTWRPDPAGVTALLPAIEQRLAPFAPRPHWGKLFAMDPATLASRYERMADFRRLRSRLDPAGTFGNPFLDRYLGEST